MNKKIAVICVNIGSPESYKAKDIKSFLKDFLSDDRVITLPKFLWQPILRLIVLTIRPKKLAHLYKKIWTTGGSPLIANSVSIEKKLTTLLNKKNSHEFFVKFAFCYSKPNIGVVYNDLLKKNIDEIIVLPLYPQYSSTTTGTTIHQITNCIHPCQGGCAFRCKNPTMCQKHLSYKIPKINIINDYYDNKAYINALSQSVKNYWQKNNAGNILVFSFHGLPDASRSRGDPYHQQCKKSAELIAKKLNLSSDQFIVTFQSRFGFAKWLQPYTQDVLLQLAKDGKKVDIICPGFAVDCLETLEEISLQLKQCFIEAGGKHFNYIKALNDSDLGVSMLADILLEN